MCQPVKERREEERGLAPKAESSPSSNSNIAQNTALFGQSLRKLRFIIEQVDHRYGDVCQVMTGLADEQGTVVTRAQFHTLNLCLANAIAGAGTSWNEGRNKSLAEGKARRDLFRREIVNLVDTATVSLDALRVEGGGAAAAVLGDCLGEVRSLLEDSKWATC